MSGDASAGLSREQCDFVVVGAGFAGLTAALRLKKHGSVIVLEARAYVGGRVKTDTLPDGTWLDLGGTWFGPHQDYAYHLAAEMRATTYPTYYKGDSVLLLADGTRVQKPEEFPLRELITALGAGWVLADLDAMAKEVPLAAPWTAPKAREWDQQTFAAWVAAQLDDEAFAEARQLLGSIMEGFFTADPAEISLLHALYLIRSHDGLDGLTSIHGGDQQDRIVHGMQSIAKTIHEEHLGDAVRLNTPVRQITWRQDGGVEVVADGLAVSARYAVVAMPPTVAGRIRYEPPLPAARAMLTERSPSGEVFKFLVQYPTPFWQKDGLSGMSGAVAHPVTMTIDGGTNNPDGPGLLIGFASGRNARAYAGMSKEDRQCDVIATLVERFGPEAAASHVDGFYEHQWTTDPWSGGGMIVHFPPGVLTNFGPALTDPVGPIHWAGSESSAAFHCSINAAIESGERAAQHIAEAMGGG